jgi:hypothetical protein
MYRCSTCKVVQLPKVPCTVVAVQTRPKQYSNLNIEGEAIGSTGHETVREQWLCPSCAELPALRPPVDVVEAIREAIAAGEHRFNHARSCKKVPSECKLCRANIAWFAELPASVLAEVLQ